MAVILGLSLLVGVAAIGANLYQSAQSRALIQRNLPAAEAARALAAQSVRLAELAPAYGRADSPEALEQVHRQLHQGLDRIAAAARVLTPQGTDAGPGLASTLRTDTLRARMDTLHARARDRLDQVAALDAALARLIPQQAELAALAEGQIDIARIRVTAGIADLYAHPGRDTRARLDALADRDFFAFERLTELSGAVAQAGAVLFALRDQTNSAQVLRLREDLSQAMRLARARLADMPGQTARSRGAELVAALMASTGPEGAFQRQSRLIATGMRLDAALTGLRANLAGLASAAHRAETEVLAQTDRKLERLQASARIGLAGLAGLLALALAGGLAAWRFARRRIVARLAAVSSAIVSVARGRHDGPIAISGEDEIGRMERALEILRQRSEQARRLRRDLEQAVRVRTGDLVAEMQAHDAARDRAEAASRAKTDFLARMSHEIRTPLNGVLGMLDLLEADLEQAPAAQRDRARIARQSAADLLALVNDILTFSAAPPQGDALIRSHFDLRALVGQLDGHLRAQAAAKGLQARSGLSAQGPVTLYGDAGKIRQVMLNLISNAVKYTAQGGVSLSVDLAQDEAGQPVLSLAVRDTGPGMHPDTVSRVFSAYERADPERGIEGLGLGLAIAQRLTQAMGGGLVVQSAPGAGSCFTLTVPLAFGDPEQVAAKRDHPARSRMAGAAGYLGNEETRRHATPTRVLVIDDHPVNRMVARGCLERLGAEVTEAATGAEALRLALDPAAGPGQASVGEFDLILIDLGLPDMDGAQVAAALRKAGHPARRVALTASMPGDDAATRQRLAVDQVLVKPASTRMLAALLTPGIAAAPPPPDKQEPPPMPTAVSPPEVSPAEGGADDPVTASLRADCADIGADITADLVRTFLADLPAAVSGLAQAGLATDSIRARAHRLKGAAANFALDGLTAHLTAIEAAARDGQTPKAALAALPALADQAAQALRAAAARLELRL